MTVPVHKKIQFDYNYMLQESLGANGIDAKRIDALLPQLQEVNEHKERVRGNSSLFTQWMYQAEHPLDVEEIIQTADGIRKKFKAFVMFGIGGSALGPIAMLQALNHLRHNELPEDKRNGVKIYVEDNIDPERMTALLDVLEEVGIENTCFNIVTKSGSTAETLSQYFIVRDLVREKIGNRYNENFIFTTTQEHTSEDHVYLFDLAREERIQCFYIPDGTGGRFSILSPVGFLPAAVAGFDLHAFLNGVRDMDVHCNSANAYDNPALFEAALMYLAAEDGKNISVIMPYADGLKYIADWYAQLLAESLGKTVFNAEGKEKLRVGITPAKALGVTDQHSQMQLYIGGPLDKYVTIIAVENFKSSVSIPAPGADDKMAYLGGHTLNQLLRYERLASEYAMYLGGIMSQTIVLDVVDEYTLGSLMYYYMMVITYLGFLWGIDPFDQPAVEEGKNAARALLGGPDDKNRVENIRISNENKLGKYMFNF